MSLHAILEAVRASGEAQIDDIEAHARSQVYEILANARLEAEQIHEKACAEAVAPATKERARLLHRARLEALQTVGNVREALIDTALERTRGHLSGMRTDRSYPEVLRLLTLEALEEIKASIGEAGMVDLEVDPRDRVLAEKIILNLDAEVTVSCNLECWGGLIAKSSDGRVVVINTLESRLERATPYLRHCLAALFEAELDEYETGQPVRRAAAYG